MATLVSGFLMGPIISELNWANGSSEAKGIGALVWCFLASLLLLFAGERLTNLQFTPQSLAATFLAIFVMAIGLSRSYFQPSIIAQKIERST